MDPKKITELAKLLRNNGDKILNSEFRLTLSGSLLCALNDSFTLIADSTELGAAQTTFQVVKPINSKSLVFRDLQLIYDFVQKTSLLCIAYYPSDGYFEGTIDIGKFRVLKRLEIQKTNVRQIVGIQPLRSQLQQLICVKSLRCVDDIITHCGGDNSNGFVWNELKVADFSYNNLQTIDTSLEFAQFLQHLNLRHNQLRSVEAIKWLPHLKTLDLSFNCLQCVPQFHMEAYKRLQSLNMGNNFLEDLLGIARLDALTDLDLSDNCLLDHSNLLPLSALVTLKYLNLYGNPLTCHPKHRLATAQFLHKNTATVKFILDFEPLSRGEKAITGTQQLRHVGSFNRYAAKSTATSISSGRLTSDSNTPASSVGSLRSFQSHDSQSDAEASSSLQTQAESNNVKKRASNVRTVEIEENVGTSKPKKIDVNNVSIMSANSTEIDATRLSKDTRRSTSHIEAINNEHLEAKKQIEALREKYGEEWLQYGNAEMMNSVLGNEFSSDSYDINKERNISRQLFNDYLGELSATAVTPETFNVNEISSSTPTNNIFQPMKDVSISPIESSKGQVSTLYMSVNSSSNAYDGVEAANQTIYESIVDSESPDNVNKTATFDIEADDDEDDEPHHLRNIYSSTGDEEPELSEPEDDEETYIVYTSNRNDAIFLTISCNFLRERDTLTQRTKTKWSLKILESCDRIKSNTLRINFDTVKVDKKERIYTVEDGLCQELEKKLRDILSQRDLTEMNQTIYRCVNCTCQFSRENKYKTQHREIRCPDCKSTFIAEMHDIPESLEKLKSGDMRLSPAAIVEELVIATPLVVQRSSSYSVDNAEDANSIGKGQSRLHAINTQKSWTLMQYLKSSANSLNESSSCSKISNSQSSFDSNQSVVGSSNTERDNDFRTCGVESDVDILSNPSQSSIEVLDQMHYSSRKTSEERRISQIPNLERIDDHSYTQSYLEREFGDDAACNAVVNEGETSTLSQQLEGESQLNKNRAKKFPEKEKQKTPAAGPLAHLNLTESSSSGSVTDSICTAYEQAEKLHTTTAANREQKSVQNLLVVEGGNEDDDKTIETANGGAKMRKEDSGISSMFGALFQSTNMLMSSSKKLIDAEARAPIQSGQMTPSPAKSKQNSTPSCKPYKFNYSDFNDVDHRLKLYFYQTKFEENGEHFKWIVRGRIYNESTHTLCDGIVVMSTCKIYLMEAYASENDDVTKWLRHILSVTVDRLQTIQLLPWKIGLSFYLRDWGGFLLLLQDILRTDSLLLYFANNSLPSQCELIYQPAEPITKRLNDAVVDEKLNMCSLLNGCEVTFENAKRSFSICGLLTTDTHLCITSNKLAWLSLQQTPPANIEPDIQICMTQFMSNLVEVDRQCDNVFTINFLDETQNKHELWECTFETKENADSCLNAIGQSWEPLFSVPLFTA